LSSGTDLLSEWRRFVDFEEVEGKMFGPHGKRFVEIVFPILKRLVRQTGDQIETDIVKASIAKELERIASVVRVVPASQKFQCAIVEGLDSETSAVYSERTESLERLRRNCGGIHFHRDLDIIGDIELAADCVQDLLDLERRQQRRRAAAEVDRIN
jgi:hypothetical protein